MRFGALRVGSHLAFHLENVAQPAVFQAVAEVRLRAITRARDQSGGPQSDAGEFVEHVQREPPFRPVMLGIGDPASLPTRCRVRSSQEAGRNKRQASGHEAVSEAAWTLASIWQLPTFPKVPEYRRATPADALPSLGKSVSSTTHTYAGGPSHGPSRESGPDVLDRPDRGRYELLQLLMVHAEAFGHRLHRLAPAIQQQAPQIQATLDPLIPPHQRREHLGGELLQPDPKRSKFPSPHTTSELPDTHRDKTS
ncbi:hypothetical protein OTB20_41490 [Streptomyces sp. H27-H1]|nr:hypothetical protein [Streptomyces sp. H27-H1]MCY0932498.1 hypothetical protein [Streptomyces sp. H27-H1]